jgi:hypothetical protein
MSKDKKKDFVNPVWVVLRDGKRVSDVEYDTSSDAQSELQYWTNIINKWCKHTRATVACIESKKKKDK